MQDFENTYNPYYKLTDGKVYDKDKKVFVTSETDTNYKAFLDAGNKPLSIGNNGYTYDQLINSVIKFYGWEVGECLLSLEQLKEKKLYQLKAIANSFENNLNKEMYFTSSLGFKSDGDRRTRSNIEDLIAFFDVQAKDGFVEYRDYNNEVHNVTKEQLTTLLGEQVLNGKNLYTQKWDYETAIKNADSLETLKNINIHFTMSDFSNKPKSLSELMNSK